MKLTKEQLQRIIKEEMNEIFGWVKKDKEEEEGPPEDERYRAAGVGRIDHDDDKDLSNQALGKMLDKDREEAAKKEKWREKGRHAAASDKLQKQADYERGRTQKRNKSWRKRRQALKNRLMNQGLGISRHSQEEDIDQILQRVQKDLNLDKSWAAVDVADIDAWLKQDKEPRNFMQKAGSFLTGKGFKESKLRLTKEQLRRIIKEELSESYGDMFDPYNPEGHPEPDDEETQWINRMREKAIEKINEMNADQLVELLKQINPET